jgi:hypothetical protein
LCQSLDINSKWYNGNRTDFNTRWITDLLLGEAHYFLSFWSDEQIHQHSERWLLCLHISVSNKQSRPEHCSCRKIFFCIFFLGVWHSKPLKYYGKIFWSFNSTLATISFPSEQGLCLQFCASSEEQYYNYRLGFCVCPQALRHEAIKFSFLETMKYFFIWLFSVAETTLCSALERMIYPLIPFTHMVKKQNPITSTRVCASGILLFWINRCL